MFKQFSYTSPLSKQFFQVTHPEIWDKMMIAWEQEKYSEVIYGVFEYLGQPLSENEQISHPQTTHPWLCGVEFRSNRIANKH